MKSECEIPKAVTGWKQLERTDTMDEVAFRPIGDPQNVTSKCFNVIQEL